jgi:glyoxylase-like metal-dependent hydrolase (beta-lactamase superfamily II)
MKWTITPILAGEFGMVRDDIKFRGGDPAITGMVPSIIFMLKSSQATVLVDTSFGETQHCIEQFGLIIEREGNYGDVLKRNGIVPEEVDAIILTHLDWDHADNLDYFEKSTIYCQKRELDGLESSDPLFLEGLKNAKGRMKILDGDYEVYPGISLKLWGGHTNGLQMVVVNTHEGEVLIPSDNIMTLRNFSENIPIGLCKEPAKCETALSWARSTFNKVFPSHDYATLNGGENA